MWDVYAWRDEEDLFVESKMYPVSKDPSVGDDAKANWMEAAVSVGGPSLSFALVRQPWPAVTPRVRAPRSSSRRDNGGHHQPPAPRDIRVPRKRQGQSGMLAVKPRHGMMHGVDDASPKET